MWWCVPRHIKCVVCINAYMVCSGVYQGMWCASRHIRCVVVCTKEVVVCTKECGEVWCVTRNVVSSGMHQVHTTLALHSLVYLFIF